MNPIVRGLLLGTLLVCNRATPSSAPLAQPKTSAPVATAQTGLISMAVFFTDPARYEAGTPPFEAPVTRLVEPSVSLPEAALVEFLLGPTPDERADGLENSIPFCLEP